MNSFLKYVLATIVGIIACTIIFMAMGVVTLIGMANNASNIGTKPGTVMVLQLRGTIEERTEKSIFASIIGNNMAEEQSLEDILKAISNAKNDDNICGIYIESRQFLGASPASLQEIREALLDFKKADKKIVAYADDYTQGAYYLCSTADSILINHQGSIDWKGIALQTYYMKDILDKIGVKMQIFKVGTFKSAVEPFSMNSMSEANREQLNAVAKDLWSEIRLAVSKSRHISAETLDILADSTLAFAPTSEYKTKKLVDKLVYSNEVPSVIANTMGFESADDYSTITYTDLASTTSSKAKSTSGNMIAVYYANGSIVEERTSDMGFGGESEIVGSEITNDIMQLATDDEIKAIVVRVNSPGGSAYASEQIWNIIEEAKKHKPVVVSMGDYAASGGYYISCGANWIVAQPTTLTGSIGIFGMIPDASELMNNKLGIHVNGVKTHEHSDMLTGIDRPMTPSEASIMQRYINRGYELFTARCAEGRHKSIDRIKEVAEGRVWTGKRAKELGLVDQLGGLETAVIKAAELAEIEDYSLKAFPNSGDIFETLLAEISGTSYADRRFEQSLGEYARIFATLRNINKHTGVQAELPYLLDIHF